MAKHIYRVINEHTLGCVQPHSKLGVMGVLHASVLRGATHFGPMANQYQPAPGDKIRVATREDFDAFRVVVPLDFVDDPGTEPVGKLRLVRDVLGTEVYADENGVEWVAQPDGSLIR